MEDYENSKVEVLPAVAPEKMTNAQVLEYVQEERARLLAQISVKGYEDITKDKDTLKAYAGLLNDMAQTAVQDKRIEAESENQESNRQIALAVIEQSRKLARQRAAKILEYGLVEETNRPEMVPSGVFLEEVEVVPGEMLVGSDTNNYETFMSRYRAEDSDDLGT